MWEETSRLWQISNLLIYPFPYLPLLDVMSSNLAFHSKDKHVQ